MNKDEAVKLIRKAHFSIDDPIGKELEVVNKIYSDIDIYCQEFIEFISSNRTLYVIDCNKEIEHLINKLKG